LSLIVADHPRQPIAEAFRNLRTSIQFSSLDHPARTLLVTSPLPTDGKTFTAANLAVALAHGGNSVVLVDADLRHPMLYRLFGLTKEPGLTAALLSPDERAHALRPTEVEGLRVVTSGSHASNPAEMLASERMREFVSWLAEEADVVVIDSPPVLAVTDAVVLSTQVDGTLLIVDCGETRKPAATQAVERLTSVGGKVLGVVLNRLTASGDGYYYYYYYPYYHAESGDRARQRGLASWAARLLRTDRRRRGKRRRRHGDRGDKESEQESEATEILQ
jgi:capsular exopolysaccharide synthesis family protein